MTIIYEWLASHSEALFGFLGVIIGGFITFFIQLHFWKKNKFEKNKTNYTLATNELLRVCSEQSVLLEALTRHFPEQEPEVLLNTVMPNFSTSMKAANFETEKLISLLIKGKTFFDEIQLAFYRYNSSLELFSNYIIAREKLEPYKKIEALHLKRNSISVIFDPSNPNFVITFLNAENMLRALITQLNQNIIDCRKLLEEMSEFSYSRYKTKCELSKALEFPSYISELIELTPSDLPPFKKEI